MVQGKREFSSHLGHSASWSVTQDIQSADPMVFGRKPDSPVDVSQLPLLGPPKLAQWTHKGNGSGGRDRDWHGSKTMVSCLPIT